jgi:energy-coupling factor transporter ATP-binding protein EcfA2
MELSGRPLFDNPLDHRLFVERPEAGRIEANCRDGVNTLLLGERGMGKTSLLNHVLFNLREHEFPAVGVSGEPAENSLDLLRLIVVALGRVQLRETPLDMHAVAGLGEVGETLRLLDGLRGDGRAGQRTAILVDLPPGKKGLQQLFGRFRDEIWQLPYTWVVAAPNELRMDLLSPPADAFFEDVVQLGSLTAEQQAELVSLRLDPGESTPWRLGSDDEANPRRLLEIVRTSVRTDQSPSDLVAALAEREKDVAKLGRSASMLYAELEDYGPASASDAGFLDRLGWSRQRAAKILLELEGAGFVTSEYRSTGTGRPRRIFAIDPPATV